MFGRSLTLLSLFLSLTGTNPGQAEPQPPQKLLAHTLSTPTTFRCNQKDMLYCVENKNSVAIPLRVSDYGASEAWVVRRAMEYRIRNDRVRRYVETCQDQEIRNALRIWAFVCENRQHWKPPGASPGDIQVFSHYWRNYGGSLCGDTSVILAKALAYAGYKARYVGVTGHTTTEVFVRDTWFVVDGDRMVVFPRSPGSYDLLSASEICGNMNVVQNALRFVSNRAWVSRDLYYYGGRACTYSEPISRTIPERTISWLPRRSRLTVYAQKPPLVDPDNPIPDTICVFSFEFRVDQDCVQFSTEFPIFAIQVRSLSNTQNDVWIETDQFYFVAKAKSDCDAEISAPLTVPIGHVHRSLKIKASGPVGIRVLAYGSKYVFECVKN